MKLFKRLLVAPAALGLLAPLAANASEVNLNDVFWKLPVIPYYEPSEGIIKKQMKINSNSKEELVYVHS